jgi:hypothetical protein
VKVKTYAEWLLTKENAPVQYGPEFNSLRANPQPQVKLSDYAAKISDLKWHQVYDTFTRQHARMPADQNVVKMGQALYQAATTGDMSHIRPYLTAAGAAPMQQHKPASLFPRMSQVN